MPQPLDELPVLVQEILKEAGIDRSNYDGCRFLDRGGHYFVALYPRDDVDVGTVDGDAGRLQEAGTAAGVGERGWLLLPKVDKPGALDPDVGGFEVGQGRDD